VVRPPPPAPEGAVPFRFVSWDAGRGQYRALVPVNRDRRPRDLGFFQDEEAAALAVDNVLYKKGGPHARVNFPNGAPERVEQALEAHEARPLAVTGSLNRRLLFHG
jgi:hypothetical protein